MDSTIELDSWHIECIRNPLKSKKDKKDYISAANIFIREIWRLDELHDPAKPPLLRAVGAQNSSIPYQGGLATSALVSL